MSTNQRFVFSLSVCLILAARGNAQTAADDEENLRCLDELDKGTSYVFVIDASGSMGEDTGRIEAVKESARGLVHTMDAEDEVALFTFQSCGVDQLLEFTDDKDAFLSKVQGIQVGGDTSLALGIRTGGEYLLSEGSGNRKALVVLTDGEETCSGDPGLESARFREQLEFDQSSTTEPEPPEIQSIVFVGQDGNPVQETRGDEEFFVRVQMSRSPTRCIDTENVQIEFVSGEEEEPESFSIEVVETGRRTNIFESEMLSLAGDDEEQNES